MKILGIDYGSKRIGLAVSDESKTFAREFGIVSPREFWKSFKTIVRENEIEKTVVGWPLNMSGETTKKTREVELFVEKLRQQTDIPVETADERLTSVMAGHLPGGKKNVDSLAAQILLQNFLDRQGHI